MESFYTKSVPSNLLETSGKLETKDICLREAGQRKGKEPL